MSTYFSSQSRDDRTRIERLLQRLGYLPDSTHLGIRLDEHFGEEYFRTRDALIDDLFLHRSEGHHPDAPSSTFMYEMEPLPVSRVWTRCGKWLDTLYTKNEKGNVKAWCEHTPANVFQVDRISRLFDDGPKFIHIMRHPADVVASYLSHDGTWTAGKFENVLTTVRSKAKAFCRHTKNNEDNVLYVRLEDLMSDPENTMENVLSYAEVELDSSRFEYDLDPSRVRRAMSELTEEKFEKVWGATRDFYSRYYDKWPRETV